MQQVADMQQKTTTNILYKNENLSIKIGVGVKRSIKFQQITKQKIQKESYQAVQLCNLPVITREDSRLIELFDHPADHHANTHMKPTILM